MSKLTEAKRIKRNYKAKFDRLKTKVRQGSNSAALKIITALADYETELLKIGYTTDDYGNLIRRTKKWRKEQLAKQTDLDRLVIKAREDGDWVKVFRCMAENEGP